MQYDQWNKDTTSLCSDLLVAATKCQERENITKINVGKKNELDAKIMHYQARAETIRKSGNHLTRMCKNVESFLSTRKEINLKALNDAIREVSVVVPNADVSSMSISIKGKTARVLSENGRSINRREGSAARTTMSVLMRCTGVMHKPNALQMVLFDEAFSTLSDISTDNLREYVRLFGDKMLIIGIEQRKLLFEGLAKTYVKFTKVNGETKIEVSEE